MGRKHTDESRAKIAAANIGQKRSPEMRAAMSAAAKGRVPWNKGRKMDEAVRLKMSADRKGKPLSPAWRANVAAAVRRRGMSDEHKAAIRRGWAERHEPTSIEVAVARVLDALGIVYEAQAVFGPWIADFHLPDQKIIIEADGTYWHSLSKQRRLDRSKDSYFRNRGYRMVRLPESDIKRDPHACVVQGLAG